MPVRRLCALGLIGFIAIGAASAHAQEVPKHSVVTPAGAFSESYTTPTHTQGVVTVVTFDSDGSKVDVDHHAAGKLRFDSWMAVRGGKPHVMSAEWNFDVTLDQGVNAELACGAAADSLQTVQTWKSLMMTGYDKNAFRAKFTPRESDKLCRLSVSFSTYSRIYAKFRFAQASPE